MVVPALIGAGTSILGGLFGRKSEKKAIAAQNEYNKPINVRARAEEAGFNPLLFVGPGVGQQTTTGGTNYMGAAIADAGLLLADSLSKKKDATALTALQKQNKELADKVTSLTLRPKVGGVYERRQAVPSIREALGVPETISTTSIQGVKDAKPSLSPDGIPLGDIAVPDPSLDRGTSSVVNGTVWESAPGWSPAAIMEEEYGDIGGSLYGIPKAAADLAWNVKRAVDIRKSIKWKEGLIESYKPKAMKPSLRPYPNMRFDPKRGSGYVFP